MLSFQYDFNIELILNQYQNNIKTISKQYLILILF
jgi:hypothetical protein